MYYATIIKTFSAAHSLRGYQGKCEKVHGHNYKVEVELKAPRLDQTGMVTDFELLRQAVDKVFTRLDHQNLNEVTPFTKINPTAEYLTKFIYEEMVLIFNSTRVKVSLVAVWENDGAKAAYTPK